MAVDLAVRRRLAYGSNATLVTLLVVAMRTSRSGTKAARMGVWWPTYAPISW